MIIIFNDFVILYCIYRVVYCDCDFYFGGFGFVGGVCVYYCEDDGWWYGVVINVVVYGERDDVVVGVIFMVVCMDIISKIGIFKVEVIIMVCNFIGIM